MQQHWYVPTQMPFVSHNSLRMVRYVCMFVHTKMHTDLHCLVGTYQRTSGCGSSLHV